MARRSLKPQLNQIRAWVRQGRTDAWIAHQLEISASELREFRKQHDLSADDEDGGAGEVDLRDEIEAEIEAAAAEAETGDAEEDVGDEESSDAADDEDEDEEEEDEQPEEPASEGSKKPTGRPSGERRGEQRSGGKGRDGEGKGQNGEGGQRRRRRRGRRGGRGRRRKAIEATFDHGEAEGYGLWLDPAVQDNPVYAEHWSGKREVTVTLEPDQIVIRRAGDPGGGQNQNQNKND